MREYDRSVDVAGWAAFHVVGGVVGFALAKMIAEWVHRIIGG